MDSRPFWTLSAEQALKQVDSQEGGLSSAEAAARLKRRGPNELAPPRRFEALREILRYIANPLVVILLLASGVSAAFGQVGELGDHRAHGRPERGAQLHPGLSLPAGGRSGCGEQVGQTAAVLRDGS